MDISAPGWKKKLSKVGWIRNAYYTSLSFAGICLRPWTQRQAEDYCAGKAVKKLNLGCGKNILQGWLNTDLQFGKGILFLDASKRLPFESETFDYIFTEHMIEHLPYPLGRQMLFECFRVLKKGGHLRVATPDLEFLIRFYQDKDSDFKKQYAAWAADAFFPEYGKTQEAFVLNNFFHSWGHQFIYDYPALSGVLQDAGFTGICRREVGQSAEESFRDLEAHGRVIGDDRNRYETMVLEAVKF